MRTSVGIPRLCILTGVPGCGKSTVANLLTRRLPLGWTTVHTDDFIGPTLELFRPEPWSRIRQYRPILAGWGVGWHLSQGRSVLVEGHLKDRKPVRQFLGAVSDRFPGRVERKVVWLDGDVEEIVKRVTVDPYRETDLRGADRESQVRAWITQWDPAPSIADISIDGKGKSIVEIEAEVASFLGL